MPIRFTNTLTGTKQDFEPIDPPRVGIYLCGPTVYDRTHMGHARPAIVFDVLRRHLTRRGYDVFFVRNVTDIDDKIINRSKEEGVPAAVIADRYTRDYDDAMRELNVLDPEVAPRATGHLLEMQQLIAELIDRGFAYASEGSVYYAVEKFADYGRLSGRSLDELNARERVEPAPGKAHPLDFALWKAAKPDEPSWPSPWGPGRPGWHIECSAMAAKYLGTPFDIHAGGADLIFPHHENEIAQSVAASGEFARWWLHNGHIQVGGEKMSKSLRNFVLVEDALANHPAPVLRLFVLSAHYRSQMSYDAGALDEARAVWERFLALRRAADLGGEARDRLAAFDEALDDDLNTPRAIAELHAITTDGNRAIEAGDASAAADARAALEAGLAVLGCDNDAGPSGGDVVGGLVEALLEQREQARAAKDFGRADALRDRLAQLGVVVEDSAQGPRWHLS